MHLSASLVLGVGVIGHWESHGFARENSLISSSCSVNPKMARLLRGCVDCTKIEQRLDCRDVRLPHLVVVGACVRLPPEIILYDC